jgi:hypothetical protein
MGGSPHIEVDWLKLVGGYHFAISAGLANTKRASFPILISHIITIIFTKTLKS